MNHALANHANATHKRPEFQKMNIELQEEFPD